MTLGNGQSECVINTLYLAQCFSEFGHFIFMVTLEMGTAIVPVL